MNVSAKVYSVILKGVYVSLLLIFAFAMFEIVQLQQRNEEAKTLSALIDEPNTHTNFRLTSNLMVASSLTSFSIDGNGLLNDRFLMLALVCSVSFLLIYLGVPAYNFLTFSRPVRQINDQLIHGHAASLGKWNPKREVHALYQQVSSVLEQQQSATRIIDGLNTGHYEIENENLVDNDRFGGSLSALQNRLRMVSEEEKKLSFIHSNVQQLERTLKEESTWETLVVKIITSLSKSVNAGIGVIYGWEAVTTHGQFRLLGAYGIYNQRQHEKIISSDQGQLGELARQRKMHVIDNVPKGYLVIHSGLGSASATNIIMMPLLFKGELYGAVELGFFKKPEVFEMEWLERACESIGAHFFNHKINEEAKRQLEVLAEKQAAELVEIHRLQRETFRELELKLEEVEEEKRKNVAILEGCVDGVVVFNESGEIEFANQAACEILGLTRDHLVKNSVSALLPVVIRQDGELWKTLYVRNEIEKEINVRTEASFQSLNGDDTDVLITCTQARTNAGMVFTFFMQKISVDLF